MPAANGQMLPVVPRRDQTLVAPQVHFRRVGRCRRGEPLHHFDERRSPARLRVDLVERAESRDGRCLAQAFEQYHHVEIVTHRVPRGEEPGLDPRHLREGWDPQAGHRLDLERSCPAQLPDARHDAVQSAEDHDRPLQARGLPAGGRLERGEHLVETRAQVLDDVIAVEALAMPGVQGRGRAADEHRPRHESLQVALSGQEALPVGQALGAHRTKCSAGGPGSLPAPQDVRPADLRRRSVPSAALGQARSSAWVCSYRASRGVTRGSSPASRALRQRTCS